MTVAAYSYWPTNADTASSASSAGSSTSTATTGYWPVSTDGTADGTKSGIWKEAGGASFHDLLDIINPLQHLPVVGTVYRWLTGDEPGNLARVVGDGLYGGPVGAVTGLFNAISRDGGEDFGERIMTWAFGPGHSKSEPDQGATAVAAAMPSDATADNAAPGQIGTTRSPAPVTATELADLTPPKRAMPGSTVAATAAAAGSTRSVASAAALYRATEPASRGTAAAAAPVAASTSLSAGSSRSVASVAALYRSTDPTVRGTAVAAAKADHVPMPLARTASTAATPAATNDPAHQLSAENAMLQRQISAGRSPAAPGQPQLVNTPVPLQLTGQSLPAVRPRVMAAPAGATKPEQTNLAAIAPTQSQTAEAGKTPLAPAAPADLAVGTPAEISQKMMAALDKYMRLQQQQGLASTAGGRSQVDVSP